MQSGRNKSESILPYDDVTGVILAGGQSSRMGRDKASLEIGGMSFFEKITGVFQSLFSTVLIAGNRPDLAGPELPYLPDRYPGSALGGLYTGLLESRTSFVFVSPCDLPFPRPGLIRHLVDHRFGYDVVVPRTEGGLEPVFAVYGRNCLEPMQEMLERNHYRIHDLFPRVRTLEINSMDFPEDWKRSLWNVNTLEDYYRVREQK